MSTFTLIPPLRFGPAHQDTSISYLRSTEAKPELQYEPDGSILLGVYEYGSDYVLVWRCANLDSAEYFQHRFSKSIDTWHDQFSIGPVMKFTLHHQPAASKGDIGDQIQSDIEISFCGWLISGDEDKDCKIYTDLEEAIEVNNRPRNYTSKS